MLFHVEMQDSPQYCNSEKSCFVCHFGTADGSKYYNTHESQLLAKAKKPVRSVNQIDSEFKPLTQIDPIWIKCAGCLLNFLK